MVLLLICCAKTLLKCYKRSADMTHDDLAAAFCVRIPHCNQQPQWQGLPGGVGSSKLFMTCGKSCSGLTRACLSSSGISPTVSDKFTILVKMHKYAYWITICAFLFLFCIMKRGGGRDLQEIIKIWTKGISQVNEGKLIIEVQLCFWSNRSLSPFQRSPDCITCTQRICLPCYNKGCELQ